MLVARAGLARLQQERDLNRLLLRDLAAFPELLALVRDRELHCSCWVARGSRHSLVTRGSTSPRSVPC